MRGPNDASHASRSLRRSPWPLPPAAPRRRQTLLKAVLYSRPGRRPRVTSFAPGDGSYPGVMTTRVLLVEDEDTISSPLVEHLTREGFDAEVAPTIADAAASIDRGLPDFVLLDVMLPDGDGRDLCREIRRTSDVPI